MCMDPVDRHNHNTDMDYVCRRPALDTAYLHFVQHVFGVYIRREIELVCLHMKMGEKNFYLSYYYFFFFFAYLIH